MRVKLSYNPSDTVKESLPWRLKCQDYGRIPFPGHSVLRQDYGKELKENKLRTSPSLENTHNDRIFVKEAFLFNQIGKERKNNEKIIYITYCYDAGSQPCRMLFQQAR